MTDVLVLKERGLNVSCINISCGYFNPHTDEEFTVKKDLLKWLRFIEHMIKDCNETYTHKSMDKYDSWYKYRSYIDDWDFDKEDTHENELDQAIETIFDILDYTPDLTAEDLFDMYQTNFPTLEMEEFKAIRNEYFGAECETYQNN